MPFSRIRFSLAAWNLAVLGFVLVLTLGVAAVAVIRQRDAALGRELELVATREARKMSRARRDVFPNDRPKGRDQGDSPDFFIYWARRDGAISARSEGGPPGLPDAEAMGQALRGKTVETDHVVVGIPVRLRSVPVMEEGRVIGAVQVGEAMGGAQEEISRTILALVLTGGAGLLVALGGSLFLAGRAMGPIAAAMDRQRRFLADASHELRTPVAVLKARAELLQRVLSGRGKGELAQPEPSVQAEVEQMQRDADDLSELLSELLDLARLDSGEEHVALEPVPIGDAIEDLAAQLAPLAQARGIRLSARAAPVWAHSNLPRLRQALRALVDNAIKHTRPGGQVVLEASREGAFARIRVSDDGEGIAPEHLPRVFDRFYRADTKHRTLPGVPRRGAGLGLAISAQLVRLMRGDLRIESKRGVGTTATVLLPLSQP